LIYNLIFTINSGTIPAIFNDLHLAGTGNFGWIHEEDTYFVINRKDQTYRTLDNNLRTNHAGLSM